MKVNGKKYIQKPQGAHRSNIFESNGPQGKIKGTAQQLVERYMNAGVNLLRNGDTITAQHFFQYAEHYRRIVEAFLLRKSSATKEGEEVKGVSLVKKDSSAEIVNKEKFESSFSEETNESE